MADLLPVGAMVRLRRDSGLAAIVEVYESCPDPGCDLPAYGVRRLRGSFQSWASDLGLWHAEDTVVVEAAEAGRG